MHLMLATGDVAVTDGFGKLILAAIIIMALWGQKTGKGDE